MEIRTCPFDEWEGLANGMNKTDSEKSALKQQLFDHCASMLEKRIQGAHEAMLVAQESANSEGKSSMGDKYETSRAMGQLDRDMNARQLEEAQRDLVFLQSLRTDELHTAVKPGSVVRTENQLFFISLGLGTVRIGNTDIILLSSGAPVAKLMEGKKTGERFVLNGNGIMVKDVF